MSESFADGSEVSHVSHGRGTILLDRGETAVVRFAHGIEEVPRAEVMVDQATSNTSGNATTLTTLLRLQAECMRSVNDAWGVFSRSRIDLLPHQLWVCRRVNSEWPSRWLVADDVGLGKTIEAGLILWPLISRGTVRRLLILCPASLVEQWQQRLREMFDLRCATYSPEQDTPRSDYWGTHPFVVASLETLRIDRRDRRRRMLEAEPWDMLVVDEAHRLNASEDQGPTLGYKLVQELRDSGKFTSIVFFTGTPHRGKDFGFLSLLSLLRPEDFSPRAPLTPQLHRLREVMIRNNKQEVTDLNGRRLFQSPTVESATYGYSAEETAFYETLTDFIASGRTYANRLGDANGRAVMLVLISMQKLASSSVAAIVSALRKRLERIVAGRDEVDRLRDRQRAPVGLSLADLVSSHSAEQDSSDLDRLAELDERVGELDSKVRLVDDEELRLRELIGLADSVGHETKIERIVEQLQEGGRFAGRSVLFFTEYKATQALLLSRLHQSFGDDCTAFINGENQLHDVTDAGGKARTLRSRREDATRRFNAGEARFLVATEAGGEGIDLQENCHTLIHVDLPWNPMRLHQRVGRLNRYGQTRPVEVLTLRNPETVESRIWDHLNSKLERIQRAYTGVMDDPEDALQLVLGMASPTLFRDLFAEAPSDPQKLTNWFDAKAGSFGGKDAIEAVRQMVGACDRFDFGRVGGRLPQSDLQDLRPFLVAMLTHHRRRVETNEEGALTFKTPEGWDREVGVRSRYQELSFDRAGNTTSVAGIGHKLVDRAIREALGYPAIDLAVSPDLLERPLHVLAIRDRVTSNVGPAAVAGVEETADGPRILADWQVLRLLNAIVLPDARQTRPSHFPPPSDPIFPDQPHRWAVSLLSNRLAELDLRYDVPEIRHLATLRPGT